MEKTIVETLYAEGKSMQEIARQLNVSVHKVSYWMDRYKLKRRTISEAIYRKNNPNGDPFKFKSPVTYYEKFLMGLGLGLFWGEGMKTNQHGVRLGNTDPILIIYFRDFLENICGVQKEKIRYSLQIFGDIDRTKAVKFWCKSLVITPRQLGIPSIIKLQRKGNYKKKSLYGVLQIACYNRNLKRIIDGLIYTLKNRDFAAIAQMVEHVHGGSHYILPISTETQ